MGDAVESLTEIKVDNMRYSPLTHPASYSITEGYQVGPLAEPMTTPDHLLLLHVLGSMPDS